MTISYSDNYFKLLARWKGSAWKAVWKELLLWLLLFYIIRLIMEFGFSQSHSNQVHQFVAVFQTYTDKVPLQFLLGFYVGQVLTRWWAQVQNVPWPDDVVAWVCALIPGADEDSRLRRHLMARYMVLSETLVLRVVSTRIRTRFPCMEHLVKADLMTEEELRLYNECPCDNTKWELPIQWAVNGVLVPLNSDNRVNIGAMGHCMNAINAFRSNLRQLFLYDWICIPLVYTQTVSVVVYGYFGMCLIGHQAFGKDIDVYIPVLTILQFVFYVGWFKVAQDLMRPFGVDDDDVELNILLDRHAAVAMDLANHVTTNCAPFKEDNVFCNYKRHGFRGYSYRLPYAKESLQDDRDHPPKLHADVEIAQPQAQLEMAFKTPIFTVSDSRFKMAGRTAGTNASPASGGGRQAAYVNRSYSVGVADAGGGQTDGGHRRPSIAGPPESRPVRLVKKGLAKLRQESTRELIHF